MVKDETGNKYGLLTVMKRADLNTANGQALWDCRCDCGDFTRVRGWSLRSGETKSCGCLIIDTTIKRNTKHGFAKRGHKNPVYNIWISMKDRCNNPRNSAYAYYGGRGIKVCDRWQDSFCLFLDDVGNRPDIAHSLDRIDVNGNYEPYNVKWSTKTEQAYNRRTVTELEKRIQELETQLAAKA